MNFREIFSFCVPKRIQIKPLTFEEVIMEDSEVQFICKFFLKYISARENKGQDAATILIALKDLLATYS
jgi:hypothetical protein